jgi:hypothetical protein
VVTIWNNLIYKCIPVVCAELVRWERAKYWIYEYFIHRAVIDDG